MKPEAFDGFKQSRSAAFRMRNPHLFAATEVPLPTPVIEAKRIRQSSKPLLNKLEAEAMQYYDLVLPVWHPQHVKLRLANGCWFTVDFFNFGAQEAVEVKGPRAWDDALVKLKVAAAFYPEIKWRLVWKEGADWREQTILP